MKLVWSLLAITFSLSQYGCRSAEELLVDEILDASYRSVQGDIYVDVSRLVDRDVVRICFQNIYMVKDEFEKITDISSPGFKDIVDHNSGYVLWIYSKATNPLQVKLKRNDVFPPDILCTDSSVLRVRERQIQFN